MVTITQVYGVPRSNARLSVQRALMEALPYDAGGVLASLDLVAVAPDTVALVGAELQRTLTFQGGAAFEARFPTAADQLAQITHRFAATFAQLMIAISCSCTTTIT